MKTQELLKIIQSMDTRKIIQSMDTRLTTLNDRTKVHTIQIKELEKKVKELEEK